MKTVGFAPVIAWGLYAFYEWSMKLWSQTVIAPIRIDLLLIIPILAILSIGGCIANVFPGGLVRRP